MPNAPQQDGPGALQAAWAWNCSCPQACDGVGPAVELPGLRHVVDAQDEGQATREECVSQLQVLFSLVGNPDR